QTILSFIVYISQPKKVDFGRADSATAEGTPGLINLLSTMKFLDKVNRNATVWVTVETFDLPRPSISSKKHCSRNEVTTSRKRMEKPRMVDGTKDKMGESDEEWDVEEIVDHRIIDGKIQYLVKWMHWPKTNNTWEPPENLENSKELITSYTKKDSRKREYTKLVKGETGFNMGLVCKGVRGVMQLENCPEPSGEQIFYIVEWENSTRIDRISSGEAIARIPELVIKYWESIVAREKRRSTKKRTLTDGPEKKESMDPGKLQGSRDPNRSYSKGIRYGRKANKQRLLFLLAC
ncbi:unnamed protein product, partial [Allacma fusca]